MEGVHLVTSTVVDLYKSLCVVLTIPGLSSKLDKTSHVVTSWKV